MMPGIRKLRRIQLGREVTPGTAVAATSIWRGIGTLEDRRVTEFTEEDVGNVAGYTRTSNPKQEGHLTMEEVDATFEQLFHILEAGIKNVGTGVADGAGTGKIYAYPLPSTALNTIKPYTIEGGDDQEAEEMEYSFVEEFKLTGEGGGPVKVSAEWVGRTITVTTFTGALSVPSVESILFSLGKLFIDAIGGTIGTTQKSNTFLKMEVTIRTGWKAVWTGDGGLYFTFNKQIGPEVIANITFEHDGSATAEKVNWRAQTARQIRIQFEGSNLGTPGTSFTKKTLRIDLVGKWEKFEKLGEENGNDIVAGSFRARYDGTPAKFAELTVVNEIASVP